MSDEQQHKGTNGSFSEGDEWWEKSLSRRKMIKTMVGVGIGVAATGGLAAIVMSGDDDDESVQEHLALNLQEEKGWNVGADGQKLHYSWEVSADSRNTDRWKEYRTPDKLMDLYGGGSRLAPYAIATLPIALEQKSLLPEIVPFYSAPMEKSYEIGKEISTLLGNTKEIDKTLIIADLKGAESVALAAGLADVATPTILFDNWPHPFGVVPAHETLGAMLFYAGEMDEQKNKRPEKTAGLLLLDADRLTDYTDEPDKFDNRYTARVPSAENLKKAGFTSLMYVTSQERSPIESDDLNDDFVAYKSSGLEVTHIPLTRFEERNSSVAAAEGEVANERSRYGYGGGSYWFYSHYPMFFPLFMPVRLGGSRFAPPAYTPTQRRTMFSNRTAAGGAAGAAGRVRRGGVGVVSTRTSPTGKVQLGSGRSSSFGGNTARSGRSGSFGRGGGGSA